MTPIPDNLKAAILVWLVGQPEPSVAAQVLMDFTIGAAYDIEDKVPFDAEKDTDARDA